MMTISSRDFMSFLKLLCLEKTLGGSTLRMGWENEGIPGLSSFSWLWADEQD
jgi:hypothetical protein